MRVKWAELIEAFEFSNCAGPSMLRAYLERETGKFFFSSNFADADEDDPTWIAIEDANSEKFIALPDRRELELGKSLVLGFSAARLPERYHEIKDIFRRRGAYSRFKAILDESGVLQKWYDFEAEATQDALREWAAENDIEIIE
jgi:hypothetical protein